MSDSIETDIKDLLYEENFYSKEYKELKQEQQIEEIEEVEEVEDEEKISEREAFFVCDECTKQWDEIISDSNDQSKPFCPICGSINITEI